MPVQIIAHRGAGSAFVDPDSPPENTLAAFEFAWALGVPACELDVQLTADGRVLAIHDTTTARTSGQDLAVSKCVSSDLCALDAGTWKHERWSHARLPLLDDVLAALPDGRRLFIELKDGPQIVGPAAAAIRAAGKGPSQIVLISFDIDTIAEAKRVMPEMECLLVVHFRLDDAGWIVEYTEGPDFALVSEPYDPTRLESLVRRLGVDGIDASAEMPDSLIDVMRSAGLALVTWTVNDPEVALDLIARGLTAITTDRPALLREALLDAGIALA